jgi:hypothetical protein
MAKAKSTAEDRLAKLKETIERAKASLRKIEQQKQAKAKVEEKKKLEIMNKELKAAYSPDCDAKVIKEIVGKYLS